MINYLIQLQGYINPFPKHLVTVNRIFCKYCRPKWYSICLQRIHRQSDSIPKDNIPKDIKQNDINPNDIYPTATLSRTTLNRTTLSWTTLSRTTLSRTTLSQTTLSRTTLSQTTLSRTTLSRTKNPLGKFFVLGFDENWWMSQVRCHEKSYKRNFWEKKNFT